MRRFCFIDHKKKKSALAQKKDNQSKSKTLKKTSGLWLYFEPPGASQHARKTLQHPFRNGQLTLFAMFCFFGPSNQPKTFWYPRPIFCGSVGTIFTKGHWRTRRDFQDFRGSPLASDSKWCRTQNQREKSEKK